MVSGFAGVAGQNSPERALSQQRTHNPRVMFVMASFHPNLREVRSALIEAGITPIFLLQRRSQAEPRPFPDSYYWDELLSAGFKISSLFRILRVDFLIQRDFSKGKKSLWRTAKSLGVPRAVYDQGPIFFSVATFTSHPRRSAGFLLRYSSRVLTLGPYLRVSPVGWWGSPGGIKVPGSTHLKFPAPAFQGVSARESSDLRVVVVAKIGQRRKRLHWVLDYLKRNPGSFTLEIVTWAGARGAYYRRVLRRISLLTRDGEQVTLRFGLSQAEALNVMRSADIFVLPSRRELFAYSPLEAMSQGIPVLVSSKGGAVSYLPDCPSPQVFRESSRADFEEKFVSLIVDKLARKRLGEQNRKYVEREQSRERFLQSFSESYGRAIKEATKLRGSISAKVED